MLMHIFREKFLPTIWVSAGAKLGRRALIFYVTLFHLAVRLDTEECLELGCSLVVVLPQVPNDAWLRFIWTRAWIWGGPLLQRPHDNTGMAVS